MQRVTRSTAVVALPAPPAGAGAPGYFTGGDPSTGTPATVPGYDWYNMIQEELMAVVLAAGLTPDAGDMTQLLEALDAMYQRVSILAHMVVCEERPSGTGGGASIAGEQVRALNTVRHNTIVGASLSSNRITLPAGTYQVRASAPAFSCNAHQARLYNYTDSAQLLLGTTENTNENTASDNRVQTRSHVIGRITLAASKQIELRHYTEQAFATGSAGLGAQASLGVAEVYSIIEIVKEA